jgi:hypothetical protein
MKFKNLVLVFGLLSVLSVQAAHAEPAVSQDDDYIYYKYNFSDMFDQRQMDLMHEFMNELQLKIGHMHIPNNLDDATIALEKKSDAELYSLIQEAVKTGQDYRRRRGFEGKDLVPNGLFFTMGFNGSIGVGAGAGTNIMVEIVAVPMKTIMVNKHTNQITNHWEWMFEIGGLMQFGGGVVGGMGAAGRGGIGVVLGDLPDPQALHGAGLGFYLDADAAMFGGAGVTLMWIKNEETGLKNTIAYVHADLGFQGKIEATAGAAYFTKNVEVSKILGLNDQGNDDVSYNTNPPANQPPPVITAPVVTPSPSGSPVVQPPIPPSGNGPVAVHPPVVLEPGHI